MKHDIRSLGVGIPEIREIVKQTANDTLQFSSVLIKRKERFCKTAVGWVLREYSKVDERFVADFLEQHKEWVTKEVVSNATKYTGAAS